MKAINFKLQDSKGNFYTLDSFKDKNIVLYFYPKDNTSKCTIQACNFATDYEKYKNLNTVIVGVSGDGKESHNDFIQKFDIPFVLLIDPKRKLTRKYNNLFEKSMLKKAIEKLNPNYYSAFHRNTFLIDKHHNIVKMWKSVEVENHSKEVISAIEHLK